MKMYVLSCLLIASIACVSAQTEPACTLKADAAKCIRGAECCSSCCLGGVCSDAGLCFPACNETYAATREGPVICALVKEVNHVSGTIAGLFTDSLTDIVPPIDKLVDFFQDITKRPIEAFAEASQVLPSIRNAIATVGESQTSVTDILKSFNQIGELIKKLFQSISAQGK